MRRQPSPVGPSVLALLEDARIDLARAAVAVREGDNEPDFKLPEDIPDQADHEAIQTFRQLLIQLLSEFIGMNCNLWNIDHAESWLLLTAKA